MDGNKIQILSSGMNRVFSECLYKACNCLDKPGNTEKPWDDCSPEWLEKRLNDEWNEWNESHDSKELIDVINLAVFLRLSLIYSKMRNFTEEDYYRLFDKR